MVLDPEGPLKLLKGFLKPVNNHTPEQPHTKTTNFEFWRQN
jgi:hypothetical protein